MYAIVAENGRQYKIEEGQELQIDYRESSASGEEVKFERVLAISDDDGFHLGKPTLDGAVVTAEVLGITQGDKLVVQKFRRRKNSKKSTGHRQMYTSVKISSIKK